MEQQQADPQHPTQGLLGMHAPSAPTPCTAVSHGQPTPDKRTAWKVSNFVVCGASWHNLVGQGHQHSHTGEQAPSAYTSCFASVIYIGSAMFNTWMMVASQRLSCMASSPQEAARLVAQRCVLKTSASST